MRRAIGSHSTPCGVFRRKRLAVRFDDEGAFESIDILHHALRRDTKSNAALSARAWWPPRPQLGGYDRGGGGLFRRAFLLVMILCAVCCGSRVQADSCPVFLTASTVGVYNSYGFVGYHYSQYYPAGAPGPYSYEERNFFVFDIPPLTQAVVSAELWISGVYNNLDDDSEVYELNEVTNSVQTVLLEGVYQPDVFADLGDGALYGTHVFNRLDRSRVVVIPLNDAFLSSVPAAGGGQIVMGGRISTLNDLPNDYEVVFWQTSGTNTVHLALTFGAASGAPQIVQQPFGATSLLDGEELTLRTLVCGAEPISYQWQRDGVDVPGGTGASLQFAPIRVSDSGNYTLIASNSQGMITSGVANVWVDALWIASEPYSMTPLDGSGFQLTFQVESADAVTYQWFHNGVAIPEANLSTLVISRATTNDSGPYWCTASNIAGSVTSSTAYINVYQRAPYFVLADFDNQIVAEGATATFSAPAEGGPPPHYYWFFNGSPITAADSSELTIVNVTTNDAGLYSLIVSNSLGSISNGAFLTVVKAGPLDHWHLRNPLPQPNDLIDMIYANGLFVGVGIHGAVLTSPNGQDWTLQRSRTINDLNAITYGNGRFVAVGDRVILTSTNGVDWGNVYPGFVNLKSVTYGNGLFVAAPVYSSGFLVSSNSIDWQSVPVGPVNGYGVYVSTVTFAGGLFVAAGQGYQGVAGTSTNGVDWMFQELGVFLQPEQVRYAGGRFLLVGSEGAFLTSNEGSQWIKRNTGATLRLLDVAYGGGAYVAVGVRGTMFRSTDLLHWSPIASGTPDRLESILFAQNKFYVVGESGTTLTSSDGRSWARQGSGTHLDFDGMTTGENGIAIAVGKSGTVLMTSNGTDLVFANAATTNELHGVAYATWREPLITLGGRPSFKTVNRYVAVGELGTIVSSDDGINWVRRSSPTNWSLKGVTYGQSLFVAVGLLGTVVTSGDGITWKSEPSGIYAPALNDVAYGNGTFVAVMDQWGGTTGTLISHDGHQWMTAGPLIGKNLRGVTFANGTFLAVGNDGVAFSSVTGSNWLAAYTGLYKDGDNLRGVTYANGLWTIVGNNGIILTSTNGASYTWTRRFSPVNVNLHGVRYLPNGTLVAVGNAGTVLNSDRFAPLLEGARAAGGYLLTIHPGIGDTLRLQKSATLTGWSDLTTFTNPPDPLTFLDTSATNQASFYRVVSP